MKGYGKTKDSLLFFVFALLVCNTAGGLASGLARGLAFAAAAIDCALVQIAGFDGLDSAHCESLIFPNNVNVNYITLN